MELHFESVPIALYGRRELTETLAAGFASRVCSVGMLMFCELTLWKVRDP